MNEMIEFTNEKREELRHRLDAVINQAIDVHENKIDTLKSLKELLYLSRTFKDFCEVTEHLKDIIKI